MAGSLPPLPEPRGKGDVFLIDDDPEAVALMEGILRSQGYRVESETDPVRAMKKDLPFVPEVIVMDLLMPRVSGLALTRLLKESFGTQSIRVIVVSALGKKEAMERAARAGADDYVTKPIEPGELLNRVARQVSGLRASSAVAALSRILRAPGAGDGEKLAAAVETLRRLGAVG